LDFKTPTPLRLEWRMKRSTASRHVATPKVEYSNDKAINYLTNIFSLELPNNKELGLTAYRLTDRSPPDQSYQSYQQVPSISLQTTLLLTASRYMRQSSSRWSRPVRCSHHWSRHGDSLHRCAAIMALHSSSTIYRTKPEAAIVMPFLGACSLSRDILSRKWHVFCLETKS
jgi:hypothetical protein